MQSVIPSILNLLTAVACVTLGLVVLKRNPRQVTHQAFALLTGSLALWAICVLGIIQGSTLSVTRTWLFTAEIIACLMPGVFYTFIGFFPKGGFDGSRKVLWALYGSGALLALFVPTSWYITRVELLADAPPQVVYGPLYDVIPVIFFFTAVAIYMNLKRKNLHATGIERRQIQYVMFAIYGTAILAVLINFLAPVFDVRSSQAYGPISAVFLIAFFAYAMIRYHLLEVRALLARVATYATVTASVALLLVGASMFGHLSQGRIEGPALFIPPILAATLVTLFLPRLQTAIRDFVEGSLLRQRYNRHRLYDRIAEHAAEVLQLDRLLERISLDIQDTIGIRIVRVLLLSQKNPNEFTTEYSTVESDPVVAISADSPVIRYLRNTPRPLLLEKLLHHRPTEESIRIAAQLAHIDTYFCLPLNSTTGLVGILALGQKDSHDIFSKEEVASFRALTGSLGAAVVNARLYRELESVNLHLSHVFSQMHEGVVAVDSSGRVTTVNDGARRILGHVETGQPLEKLTGPIADVLGQTLQSGRPVSGFETQVPGPDGEPVPVVLSSSCLGSRDRGTTGALALLYDISRVKRLEQNVARADRLSSIGTLAAGMAHEIKNPLVSIKTFTQLFRTRYEDPEFRATFDEVVPHEVDRIDTIVSRLLDFARPRPALFQNQDLAKIIDEVLALVENQMRKHGVTLHRAYGRPGMNVRGDEQQLHQIFLNLVLNAIEAMKDNGGGDLTITVRPGTFPTQDARGSYAGGADCISTSVSDTGKGIQPGDVDQLFTPFFTTKTTGCGLGLAVAHGMVAEHGGAIDVASTEGEGTTFSVFLPVAKTLAQPEEAWAGAVQRGPRELEAEIKRPA